MLKREDIEWCQLYWFDTYAADLPRILLIGDSIACGMGAKVAEKMRGEATIGFFATSKIVGDPAFFKELAFALADYPVDLICFNNGLHQLEASDEFYRQALGETLDYLRFQSKSRIVWRNSTPITQENAPEILDAEKNAVVVRRNAIALELTQQRGIETLDLYSKMLNHPEYRVADGFHYQESGIEAQALWMREQLLNQLQFQTSPVTINGMATTYPGYTADFHGFDANYFLLDGIRCVIVKPNGPCDAKKRWLWRARFFGAFPDADLALLKLGWHIVHIEVDELYGSPESNRRFDLLYHFLTSLGFAKKCVLAGFSRGGLDTYIWSNLHPERVSCLYLDNAVCDFKSWPGGKGRLPSEPESWKNCLKAWNFSEAEALAFRGNPVDTLENLAAHKIPVIHLCGDADEVVAPEENTHRVVERYRQLGGEVELVMKPGCKHHPHSLSDPAVIVNFILKHS